MIRVLMIEDDTEFASFLAEYLAKYNIEITNHDDPYIGLAAGIKDFDLLILDLTLPGIDGLEVCREVRSKYNIPIIISSARSDVDDRVIGLQIGADDYIPKPYDPKEMHARITSLIRRSKQSFESTPREENQSAFRLDTRRHLIYFHEQELTLTPAEYEILEYLVGHHGFAISREQLVGNCRSLKDKDSKSLDVIIGRLRTKIGDDSRQPRHIFSVRGIGYKLLG